MCRNFLLAYQRSNSGGVTNEFQSRNTATPDKTENPERYKKQQREYLARLRNSSRRGAGRPWGMELELDGVNPARKWAAAQNLPP